MVFILSQGNSECHKEAVGCRQRSERLPPGFDRQTGVGAAQARIREVLEAVQQHPEGVLQRRRVCRFLIFNNFSNGTLFRFDGPDWNFLVKHVIEDIHDSWLHCSTNPLELGTCVSLSHRWKRNKNYLKIYTTLGYNRSLNKFSLLLQRWPVAVLRAWNFEW